jgi:hypothetical protein
VEGADGEVEEGEQGDLGEMEREQQQGDRAQNRDRVEAEAAVARPLLVEPKDSGDADDPGAVDDRQKRDGQRRDGELDRQVQGRSPPGGQLSGEAAGGARARRRGAFGASGETAAFPGWSGMGSEAGPISPEHRRT